MGWHNGKQKKSVSNTENRLDSPSPMERLPFRLESGWGPQIKFWVVSWDSIVAQRQNLEIIILNNSAEGNGKPC
jgi:hypothetical protein